MALIKNLIFSSFTRDAHVGKATSIVRTGGAAAHRRIPFESALNEIAQLCRRPEPPRKTDFFSHAAAPISIAHVSACFPDSTSSARDILLEISLACVLVTFRRRVAWVLYHISPVRMFCCGSTGQRWRFHGRFGTLCTRRAHVRCGLLGADDNSCADSPAQ